MKLVITINDDIYDDYLKQGATLPKCGTAINSLYEALWNGVPLPKHHGRIIDESKINTVYTHTGESINYNGVKYTRTTITHTDAPTIIEGSEGE
jgi:hypothetical protein